MRHAFTKQFFQQKWLYSLLSQAKLSSCVRKPPDDERCVRAPTGAVWCGREGISGLSCPDSNDL